MISLINRELISCRKPVFTDRLSFAQISKILVEIAGDRSKQMNYELCYRYLKRDVNKCDAIWNSIPQDQRQCCCDLHLYNELLHTFYLLRICDYKEVSNHVNILDVAWQDDMQQME